MEQLSFDFNCLVEEADNCIEPDAYELPNEHAKSRIDELMADILADVDNYPIAASTSSPRDAVHDLLECSKRLRWATELMILEV